MKLKTSTVTTWKKKSGSHIQSNTEIKLPLGNTENNFLIQLQIQNFSFQSCSGVSVPGLLKRLPRLLQNST